MEHRLTIHAVGFVVLTGICTLFLEPSAILSYAASLLLIRLVAAYLKLANPTMLTALCASLGQAVTLALYCAQFLILPDYFGFTGPEGGIGTDDHFFYSQGVAVLPDNFYLRGDYFASIYNYSVAIRFVASFFEWLVGHTHPLQVLVLNSTGYCLTPLFVTSAAMSLGYSKRMVWLAFVLSWICPFLLQNGTVLLREGWIAAAAAAAVAGFLGRRWVLSIVAVLVAFFLRLESSVLIAANLSVLVAFQLVTANLQHPLARRFEFRWGAILAIAAVVGGAAAAVIAFPDALLMAAGKAVLGRPDFIDSFLRPISSASGGTSMLLVIAEQAWPLRLIGGLLFFGAGPFLAPDLIQIDGFLVPRYILQNLYALYFLIVFGLLVRVALDRSTYSDPMLIGLLSIILVDLIAISQLSLQFRHKTLVLPIMYLLAARGLRPADRTAQVIAVTAVAALFLVQVMFVTRNLGLL